MDGWSILALELDQGGMRIADFLAGKGCRLKRVDLNEFYSCVDGGRKSFFGLLPSPKTDIHRGILRDQSKVADVTQKLTRSLKGKVLTVYGSGYYHHFTYGLCLAARKRHPGFDYVHFDRHSDSYVGGRNFELSHGNFVDHIVGNPENGFCRALMIGPPLSERKGANYLWLSHYAASYLNSGKALADLESALTQLRDRVYISFDLDVLDPSEMASDWEHGELASSQLLRMVGLIKGRKEIVGADILGYNGRIGLKPAEAATCQKSKEIYLDLIRLITAR